MPSLDPDRGWTQADLLCLHKLWWYHVFNRQLFSANHDLWRILRRYLKGVEDAECRKAR